MSKIKLEFTGFERYRLSFPESENWACDGVLLDDDDLVDLRNILNEVLNDPDGGSFTMRPIEI